MCDGGVPEKRTTVHKSAASLAGQSREAGVVRRGGGLGQAGEDNDKVVGGSVAGFRWAMAVVG